MSGRTDRANGPALALAALALAAVVTGACVDRAQVPVHTVERELFEHKVTAEGILEAARVTKVTVPTQVTTSVRLAWLLPEGERVEADEVVARFDRKAMEEKLADGQIDLQKADRQIDQSTVEKGRRIGELASDAAIAEMELVHARDYQKTNSQVFSRRELLEDAIDEQLAAQRKQHAEANAETERELAQTEVALLQIERRIADNVIDQAEQGLAALEVKAPHAGLLTYARNWRGEAPTVGSEMFRGQSVAEIPDLDSLQAQIYVLEADAGGLTVGQRAEILVEAHPEAVFEAKVERVEPVAKPRFRGSPVQYFGVVVTFEDPPDDLARLMKPGQRVRATLYLERVEDALVVPRQAVFEEDGASKVWLRRGGGFEAAEVTVGATGLGKVVVTEGLSEGDVVALDEPLRGPEDGGGSNAAGPADGTQLAGAG